MSSRTDHVVVVLSRNASVAALALVPDFVVVVESSRTDTCLVVVIVVGARRS